MLQPPWALGQACSASSSLETSGQDCIQQTKGRPSNCWAPALLLPCHYIQSRQEVHPSKETGQPEPLLPTQLQPDKCPDPREMWAPSTRTRTGPRVRSCLSAWDAAGNPREQTRACSGQVPRWLWELQQARKSAEQQQGQQQKL